MSRTPNRTPAPMSTAPGGCLGTFEAECRPRPTQPRRILTRALWMSSERSGPPSFGTCRQRVESGRYAPWQASYVSSFDPSFVIHGDRIPPANAASQAMNAKEVNES
jgi:hypothetical protein